MATTAFLIIQDLGINIDYFFSPSAPCDPLISSMPRVWQLSTLFHQPSSFCCINFLIGLPTWAFASLQSIVNTKSRVFLLNIYIRPWHSPGSNPSVVSCITKSKSQRFWNLQSLSRSCPYFIPGLISCISSPALSSLPLLSSLCLLKLPDHAQLTLSYFCCLKCSFLKYPHDSSLASFYLYSNINFFRTTSWPSY